MSRVSRPRSSWNFSTSRTNTRNQDRERWICCRPIENVTYYVDTKPVGDLEKARKRIAQPASQLSGALGVVDVVNGCGLIPYDQPTAARWLDILAANWQQIAPIVPVLPAIPTHKCCAVYDLEFDVLHGMEEVIGSIPIRSTTLTPAESKSYSNRSEERNEKQGHKKGTTKNTIVRDSRKKSNAHWNDQWAFLQSQDPF
jgi:hypothetical protein